MAPPGKKVDRCLNCQRTIGFTESDDGFSYCSVCGAQAPDTFFSLIDVDTVLNNYSNTLSRPRRHATIVAAPEPISQVTPNALFHKELGLDNLDTNKEADKVNSINLAVDSISSHPDQAK